MNQFPFIILGLGGEFLLQTLQDIARALVLQWEACQAYTLLLVLCCVVPFVHRAERTLQTSLHAAPELPCVICSWLTRGGMRHRAVM